MRGVWIALSSAGITLQMALIVVLSRGAGKRFRTLFVYVVVLFLTTVMEAAAFYSPKIYLRTAMYYWATDALRQLLIFLMVLSFIQQALDRSTQNLRFRCLLWLGAVVFTAGSLYINRGGDLNAWMTLFSRNLGFLAVILNLVLWAALLRFRQRDRVLLAVTGGMGVQMAGKAIGHSLRQLSRSTIVAGDLILVLSHILCLYIWWQAFRRFDPQANPRLE
jgi:hypothetical protein